MRYLAEALKELRPNNNWYIVDGLLVWSDEIDLRPSDEEINKKIVEIKINEKRELIENCASSLIEEVLDEYDYDDRGDVAIYALDSSSEFYEEAKAIKKWIESVDSKMYELQDLIDENNYDSINIDDLCKELPKFNGVN